MMHELLLGIGKAFSFFAVLAIAVAAICGILGGILYLMNHEIYLDDQEISRLRRITDEDIAALKRLASTNPPPPAQGEKP